MPLRRHGIPPTLGIDSVGHNAGDMFGQMRLALQWLCMAEAESVLAQGLNPSSLTVSARDALEWGTINGARALGLDGEIGSLTPGKRADVAMVRADGISLAGWQEDDPAVAVVAYAAPAEVDTVLVAGRPVKRARAAGRRRRRRRAAAHRRVQAPDRRGDADRRRGLHPLAGAVARRERPARRPVRAALPGRGRLSAAMRAAVLTEAGSPPRPARSTIRSPATARSSSRCARPASTTSTC